MSTPQLKLERVICSGVMCPPPAHHCETADWTLFPFLSPQEKKPSYVFWAKQDSPMRMCVCLCLTVPVFHRRLWNVKSLPSQESMLRHNGNYPGCHLHFKYHLFPPWLPVFVSFYSPYSPLQCLSYSRLLIFSHPHIRSQGWEISLFIFFLIKIKRRRKPQSLIQSFFFSA